MLHAMWSDGHPGLVVFGWQARATAASSVASFAATLFASTGGPIRGVELALPGRRTPLRTAGYPITLADAADGFLTRSWVPWHSISASLGWFARVAALADETVLRAAALPGVRTDGEEAWTVWQAVVDETTGPALRELAESMPPVAGALHPDAAPWQLTSAVFDAFVDQAARAELWGVGIVDPAPGDRRSDAVVARRVLTALTAEDPGVVVRRPGEREAVHELARVLDRWTGAARGRSPLEAYEVTVRIVPPSELDIHEGHALAGLDPEELPWLAELLVAPADDPSHRTLAEDIWAGPPEPMQAALRLAGRRIAAAAPTLAAAQAPGRPASAALPLTELVQLLEHEAGALEAAGIRIEVPAWWGAARPVRVRGTATPAERAITPAGLGAADLAEVRWHLLLGGEPVDEAELERLAAAKAPLVFRRGQWVPFDPAAVRHALTTLARHQDAPVPGPVGLLRLAAAEPDVELRGEGWIADLLDGLPDDRLDPVPEPDGFVGTLRPYQQRGVGWLAFLGRLGLGGCLADDMGLGKTAQVLALLAHDRGPGPTLVVCPLSVVRNWETEAARFTPGLRVVVHHGPGRDRDEPAPLAGADLVITTYAIAARDRPLLAQVPWGRVVADEAQHVKNPRTAAAKALRQLPARQRLALTGTPVENRLSELWAVMDLVNPGLLGRPEEFRHHFAVPIERHHDAERAAELRRVVQPFLLRRSKADRALVPELPPKVEQVAWATLTREQATLYRSVVDVLLRQLDHLDGMDRRGAILAALTRLKQICNHPAHYLGDGSRLEHRSGKLVRFDELVGDALDAEESLLVFTQYREMGELLARHLRPRLGQPVPFLHGGVSRAGRDRMVAAFQDGTAGPVLLVSLKAGGSGLNLTAASQVIHYDRWWNPAVEDQASDRAWRIGQRRTVLVHKLVCQGTVEERVDALITAKRALADRVVGAGEAWLTELTTDELRDLLVLQGEHR